MIKIDVHLINNVVNIEYAQYWDGVKMVLTLKLSLINGIKGQKKIDAIMIINVMEREHAQNCYCP